MEIVEIKKEDMLIHGKTTDCLVHKLHIVIKDIPSYVADLIKTIKDTGWITKLGAVEQVTFDARSKRTIEKIVNDILLKVENVVTAEFGEFMVSSSAQRALNEGLGHVQVPLAELWKEKVIGNPGFDFHTESTGNLIAFGEAKYSGSINPHGIAIDQILDFISLEKDKAELTDVQNFVSKVAVGKFLEGHRAFVAAFSINGDAQKVLDRVLRSKKIEGLLNYPEVYLIGVEVIK